MMFKEGEEHVTVGGHKVRITATDCGGNYPIHGAVRVDGDWRIADWTEDGRISKNFKSDMDIKVVKPRIKQELFINVYQDNSGERFYGVYVSAEVAKNSWRRHYGWERVACYKHIIDVEEGEGL